jgi:hypothetical protein
VETIKVQLRELGLIEAETNKKNLKFNSVEKDKELDINHQVLFKLFELILTSKRFAKATSYLSDQKLLFQPSVKKKLKKLYEDSVKSNCLDEVEFTKYILNLDFELAKKRFIKRQALRKERKKNPLQNKAPKKSKKVYKAPNRPKISAQDKINQLKGLSKLGLGIETQIKIPKIRATDVVIDKNTKQNKVTDKSILYAAGWSLSNEGDSD